jgi:t-SNARE complex subunit (syntaxin)
MKKSIRTSRHARIKEAILVMLLVLALIFILSFIP